MSMQAKRRNDTHGGPASHVGAIDARRAGGRRRGQRAALRMPSQCQAGGGSSCQCRVMRCVALSSCSWQEVGILALLQAACGSASMRTGIPRLCSLRVDIASCPLEPEVMLGFSTL